MKNFLKSIFMVALVSLSFFQNKIDAQCQQFNPQILGVPECDNKGTLTDPSDDEFSVQVYIANDLNPNGTWSTNDGSYLNEPYPITETASFGPFLISDGDLTVIFRDDQLGCMKTLVFVAPPSCSQIIEPMSCPDWNDQVNLINSDGCTHTFRLTVAGDQNLTNEVDPLLFNWLNIQFTLEGDGVITDIGFIEENGYYAQNITLNPGPGGFQLNHWNPTNNDLFGYELAGPVLEFTVEAEDVPSCFSINRNVNNELGFVEDGIITFCSDGGIFNPLEVCSEGETISGIIEAFAEFSSCNNTLNHGVQGVEVSINGANDGCSAVTGNDGKYECTLCEGGPYDICIETTCDEPCGVTSLDILLLRKFVLGVYLSHPYVSIIGDVNNSNTLSTLDLALIQRDILGLDTETIEDWCRFVPTTDLASNTNPNFATLDSCTTIDGPNEPDFGADFVRFMKGDINGSCSDCIHGDDIGNGPVFLDDLVPGKIRIKLPISDKLHGIAFQFSIPSGTTIDGVNSPLPNLMSNQVGNEFHLIWTDDDANLGYNNIPGTTIIEIEYTGIKPTMVNEENLILNESGEITQLLEKRADKREVINNVTQTLHVVNLANVDLVGKVKEATVELYNLSGVLIERKLVNLELSNSVKLESTNNLGIYILRVYNKDNDVTKKVLWTLNN